MSQNTPGASPNSSAEARDTLQPGECREAFEHWHEDTYGSSAGPYWEDDTYDHPDIQQRWNAWEAAWNARPKREAVTQEWQPIETAPRDGTEITGGWAYPFNDYSGTPICWQKGNNHEGWFMLAPHQWGEGFVLGTYPGKWIKETEYPTHWMPKLPEPKRNVIEPEAKP